MAPESYSLHDALEGWIDGETDKQIRDRATRGLSLGFWNVLLHDMIIRALRVSVLMVFVFLTSTTAFADNFWAGEYHFSEDGGATAGGTPIYVEHALDLLETDDGLIAMIQSSGFQTARDLIGTTKTDGDKLLIYFENYGENNSFQTYQTGDLLLTLERKTENGIEQILTNWGKFQPVVPKNEKSGRVYFERIESLTLRPFESLPE